MQVIQFRIFLVRHGQTDNNVRHLLQGQKLDAPLNSRGKQQSKAIARFFKDEIFTEIYCSDLKRAVETCEQIIEENENYNKNERCAAKTQSSVALELDQRLRERCMGSMEGKPISDLKKLAYLSKQHRRLFTPDGGESFEDVEKRLDEFFRYLYESVWSKANEHQSGKLPHIQTVLVVTHSGVIRAFMSLFKTKYFCEVPSNLLDLKCGNTSRTLVEVTLTEGTHEMKTVGNQHNPDQEPNPLPRVIKTRCSLLFSLTHLQLPKTSLNEP